MLVGPGRVSTSLMDDAEDGVGADKIPRINRRAASAGITDKSFGIDGSDAAVSQRGAGRTTVHLGLVDVDAFFVLAGGSSWGGAGRAGTSRESVTSCLCRGIKISSIGDVVIDAGKCGASAGDDRDQAGKGVRGFRSAGSDVVNAGLAQCSKCRAVGFAIVDVTDSVDAVLEVHSVHAIDADQKNPLDRFPAPAVVLCERRSG